MLYYAMLCLMFIVQYILIKEEPENRWEQWIGITCGRFRR